MNFTNNLWSASVERNQHHPGGVAIAPGEPEVQFAYLYAGWLLSNPNVPGNNYMAFDHIGCGGGNAAPFLSLRSMISKPANSAAASVTVPG